jgi:hypothetical protein
MKEDVNRGALITGNVGASSRMEGLMLKKGQRGCWGWDDKMVSLLSSWDVNRIFYEAVLCVFVDESDYSYSIKE